MTVIVPVYNDLARLQVCLERLRIQDYRGTVSVIVVDNASTIDLSSALPAGDDRFVLIHEQKKGSYAARNAGLERADSDIVAFTDADCLPRGDWISSAVKRLTSPGAPDAVGGAISLVFRNGSTPVTGPELYEAAHDFDQKFYIEQRRFAATANLVVTRRALDLVGAFNAELQSGGDDDWGHRLHQAGGTLHFSPESIVDHPSRPSWADLTAKSFRVARGLADLDAGQSWAKDVAHFREEAVLAVRALRVTWGRKSRLGLGARARYSAAYGWVALIDLGVRLKRRFLTIVRATRGTRRSAEHQL